MRGEEQFGQVRHGDRSHGLGFRHLAPLDAVVRFETPAARQGQVDFGTFRLPWDRRHALLVVLGYSRLLWLRIYRRQTIAVLMEHLESAVSRFGGVPRELLFDQIRSVVIAHERTGGRALMRKPAVLSAYCWASGLRIDGDTL